ncbi:hypothetical protein JCM8547_007227 [Rhodosporidiobolus lusitaniae]
MPPVSIASRNPYAALDVDQAALEERLALSLRLIDAVLEHNDQLVRVLVEQEHAECWVQDKQGWTALHAAAYTGSTEHIQLLLRKGNAVWSIPDNLGCTAGDIAYSMNNAAAYELLSQEGVRSEMLRAVLEEVNGGQAGSKDGGGEKEDAEMGDSGEEETKDDPKSTASDNARFLSSSLKFVTDASGQPIALDAEGNGVMMGWERPIMEATVERMVRHGGKGPWEDRKGKKREELVKEEEGERETLNVINVGFGLGIIDSLLQEYNPTTHLIIEPHPDVLAFARQNGWFDKPGVRFFEGTWKDWVKKLDVGEEEGYGMWDAVYFDTYSEHYRDLHKFFQLLPDLLSSSPFSRFSFFHGLGATSRLLYDVYTTVSELHLKEIGLKTEWSEVDVSGLGGADQGRWDATGTGEELKEGQRTKGEGEKKYWREDMVGRYRLPLCRLDYA